MNLAYEALAKFKDDSYKASSDDYFNVGDLTIKLKNGRGMTPEKIQGYVERNDLVGFMSRVYGRPAGINAKDLDAFMTAYGEARRCKNNTDGKIARSRIAARLLDMGAPSLPGPPLPRPRPGRGRGAVPPSLTPTENPRTGPASP